MTRKQQLSVVPSKETVNDSFEQQMQDAAHIRQARIDTQQKRIQELDQQLLSLNSQVITSRYVSEPVIVVMECVRNEVAKLRIEGDRLTELKELAEQQLHEIESRIAAAQSQMEQYSNESDSDQQPSHSLPSEVATLRVELAAVEQQLKLAREELREHSLSVITQRDASEPPHVHTELQQQAELAREQLSETQHRLGVARQQLAEVQQQIDEAHLQQQNMFPVHHDIQQHQRALEDIQRQFKESQQQVAQIRHEYSSSQQQLLVTKQNLHSNQQLLADTRHQLQEAQGLLTQSREEIATRKEELASVQEQAMKARQEYEHVRKQTNDMRTQVELVLQDLEQLRAQQIQQQESVTHVCIRVIYSILITVEAC